MHFLIRPEPVCDESLESYLLRLSQDNGFEHYRILSGSLKERLLQSDYEAAGAFPLELAKVNIFHASYSSYLRIRALCLIADLTGQPHTNLLKVTLMHSTVTFGRGHKAVSRDNTHIPLCFIRTNSIPCCPECLAEHGYVRQLWHYKPYTACHRHRRKLLTRCPACHESLNYLYSELLTHCSCGYDLRQALTPPTSSDDLQLSSMVSDDKCEALSPASASQDKSLRYGALLWFIMRYGESSNNEEGMLSAMHYFRAWPDNFTAELLDMMAAATVKQTKSFNHMSLTDVFGKTLSDCLYLPARDTHRNFILHAFLDYLTNLVMENPRSNIANPGDLLVSIRDAACLLSTSNAQVYRLLDDGFLKVAIRPRAGMKVKISTPVLHLRQVIEFRLTHIPGPHDKDHTYLSAR